MAEFIGTNASDEILGSDGGDVISALAGSDLLIAGAGNDLVVAGDGDDRVFSGAGEDTISLGAGLDRIVGDIDDLSGDTVLDFEAGETVVITGLLVGTGGSSLFGLSQNADAGTTTLNIGAQGSLTLTGSFSGMTISSSVIQTP